MSDQAPDPSPEPSVHQADFVFRLTVTRMPDQTSITTVTFPGPLAPPTERELDLICVMTLQAMAKQGNSGRIMAIVGAALELAAEAASGKHPMPPMDDMPRATREELMRQNRARRQHEEGQMGIPE